MGWNPKISGIVIIVGGDEMIFNVFVRKLV